jgi:ribose transport system substrate-binding protein
MSKPEGPDDVRAFSMLFGISTTASAAGPQIVPGPGADSDCFKPWSETTKYFKWPKKDGPYRIALVNGFIGNTWRIQMIKTAKAYADQPSVKSQLKEFKVVSTGEDLAAQIAAANNFIDAGYDAVIVNALNPAFAPVLNAPTPGSLCRLTMY